MNFYQLLGDGEIRILTFERGVEGYTRACGTGCGSVASVLWKKGLLPGGVLTAHNMGGTLKITIDGKTETSPLCCWKGRRKLLRFTIWTFEEAEGTGRNLRRIPCFLQIILDISAVFL